MLNFVSILNRFVLCCACAAYSASALPWIVQTNLIDNSDVDFLRQQIPSLETPQDISYLLARIDMLRPMLTLEVIKHIDFYEIRGVNAKVVSRMYVEGLDTILTREVLAKLNVLIKQVDSESLRRKVIDIVYDHIRTQGYLQASLTLETQNIGVNDLDFKVKVQLGKPCLIHAINGINEPAPNSKEFPIRVGDICDSQEIRQSFERYSDLQRKAGFVEYSLQIYDIRYYPKTNSAEVILNGKVGLKTRIEVKTTKGQNILKSLFSDAIEKRINVTEMDMEDIATQIADIYKNDGYYGVEVEGPYRSISKSGEQIVRFNVKEGGIFFVDRIQFVGAKSFSHSKLSGLFDFRDLFEFRKRLRMNEVDNGIAQIEALYQSYGFWDVRVFEPQIIITRPNHAIVRISLEEGKKHYLNSLSVKVSDKFDAQELKDLMSVSNGELLKQVDILTFEEKVKRQFTDDGYLYVTTELEMQTSEYEDKILVDLVLKVRERQRVRIGRVFINGLVDTKTRVVQRELLFKTGDWYNREKIETSRKFLINLAIFNSVAIQFADRLELERQADILDVEVALKEGMPGSVAFGPGWSQQSGTRFGADASYMNFAGQGRQLFARAGFSEERQQEQIQNKSLVGRNLNIGYVEPWMLSKPIDGGLSFSHIAKAGSFWSLDYIGETSLSHRFRSVNHDSKLSLFLRSKISKEIGTREQNILLVSSGDVRIASYGLRLTTDHRDDKGWPTKGFFAQTQLSWADYFIAGNVQYFNWEIDYSFYQKLFTQSLVLALGVSYTEYAEVKRFGNSDNVLPSSERSYAGGGDSVRGYDERSLGPFVTSSSDNFGGSHRAIFKAELRYQFYKPFALSLFADAGNVFFSESEKNTLNQRLASRGISDEVLGNYVVKLEEYFKRPDYILKKNFTSYGLAFGFTTPLGVLNLSYGIPAYAPKDPACKSIPSCPSFIDYDDDIFKRGRVHVNFGINF